MNPAVTYFCDSARLEEKKSCQTWGTFVQTHPIMTVLEGQADLAQMYKIKYFFNLCYVLFNPTNESYIKICA